MASELLGDRFWALGPHGTIDLATGEAVEFRRIRIESPAAHRCWLDRSTALFGLQHPHMIELVDFGLMGPGPFFEALRLGAACTGGRRRDPATRHKIQSVVDFLHGLGRSAGRASWDRVVERDHQPLLVPDASTGLLLGEQTERTLDQERAEWRHVLGDTTAGAPVEGRVLGPRAAVTRVVEMLANGGQCGFRCIHVLARQGSDFKTAASIIAREARLRGFVPVSPVALDRWPGIFSIVMERHLLVLADISGDARRAHPGKLASLLVRVGLGNARTGMVIIGCDRAPSGRAVLRLDEGCAEWQGDVSTAARAAEATALYSVPPADQSDATTSGAAAAADPGLDRARARATLGVSLWRRGLHAAAERALREAVGALTRRGYKGDAAGAALDLGRLLAERGRAREAIGAFTTSRALADEAAVAPTMLAASIGIATIWMEDGKLVEAEAAFRAVMVAADHVEEAVRSRGARAGLAACLYWQARYDEARCVLASLSASRARQNSEEERLRAQIALATSELHEAGTAAAAAIEAARAGASPRDLADAHVVMAASQAALGDLTAVRRHVAEALLVSRRARLPLATLNARVALLEALTHAGRHDEARRVAGRLARQRTSFVPGLLQARLRLAVGVATGDAVATTAARSFVISRGAKALGAPPPQDVPMDLVQGMTELLAICHEADDEATALQRACAAVRERTRSLGVAIVTSATGQPLASEGSLSTESSTTAQQAMDAGLTIAPTRTSGWIEAAAPLRYAGATIGALVCRWTADALVDAPRATALLTTAAAACASTLRLLLDRQEMLAQGAAAADHGLIGSSPAIEDVRRALRRAAAAPFPVVVMGESGSGKELVARALHRLSPRRERKLCALNCAALTDDLFEAELFGHARGAFTGAIAERAGLFEEADRGTLFLDEVGELSPRAQAKLLRTIQEGEVRRVGENLPRRVDVRVLAATNRSLQAEVDAGRFRQDLLYRLDVLRIVVPPLRERVEDIAALAAHFWAQATARTGSRATLDPAALAVLARYDWPGNVRELQNVLAALAVRAPSRGRVGAASLPAAIANTGTGAGGTLDEARRAWERMFVRAALARAGGHRGRAAVTLGLSRQGFAKLMARLELDR